MRKLYLLVMPCFSIFIGCNEKRLDAEFENINKVVPQIATLSMSQGYPGDTLVITGAGFLANSSVKFGDLPGDVIERTASKIKVVLPLGAGSLSVKVFNGDYSSNMMLFTFMASDAFGGNGSIMNIQGTLYYVDTLASYPVGPGATYMQLALNDTGFYYAPTKVHFIIYDLSNRCLSFKPVAANDRAVTTETVPDMAARKSETNKLYFAGVNGDFFRGSLTDAWYGQAYQGLMIDGEIITSPRPLSASDKNTGGIDGHIFFEDSKKMFVDYAIFKGSGTYSGSYFTIDAINKYREANHLIWCTSAVGPTSNQNSYGSEVALMPSQGTTLGPGSYNKDLQMQVTGNPSITKPALPIPSGGAVLSGHPGTASGGVVTIVNKFTDGSPLTAKFEIYAAENSSRKFDQMVGGRSIILKNGIVNDTNWATKYPRTAMGVSKDGNKVYMFVADAPGLATQSVARIMQLYGVHSALNLGSYGESTLYIKNLGENNSGFVNNPGRTTPAPNSQGVFAVSSAPDDANVSQFAPQKRVVRINVGDSFTPVFYGMNQYGIIVNPSLSGVSLSGATGIGSLSGDTFTAATAGTSELTASYNNNISKIRIIVKKPE